MIIILLLRTFRAAIRCPSTDAPLVRRFITMPLLAMFPKTFNYAAL